MMFGLGGCLPWETATYDANGNQTSPCVTSATAVAAQKQQQTDLLTSFMTSRGAVQGNCPDLYLSNPEGDGGCTFMGTADDIKAQIIAAGGYFGQQPGFSDALLGDNPATAAALAQSGVAGQVYMQLNPTATMRLSKAGTEAAVMNAVMNPLNIYQQLAINHGVMGPGVVGDYQTTANPYTLPNNYDPYHPNNAQALALQAAKVAAYNAAGGAPPGSTNLAYGVITASSAATATPANWVYNPQQTATTIPPTTSMVQTATPLISQAAPSAVPVQTSLQVNPTPVTYSASAAPQQVQYAAQPVPSTDTAATAYGMPNYAPVVQQAAPVVAPTTDNTTLYVVLGAAALFLFMSKGGNA